MRTIKQNRFKDIYLDVYEATDCGNTYFLAELFIRDKKGQYEILKQFPLQYGYGSHAEYTAKDWLVKNMGVEDKLSVWQVISSNNVKRSEGHNFKKLNNGNKTK
tara:strand:+ start:50 stop:361 length:312 start_codon:yes stop_codon:yes gene_type:complete